VSFDYTYVVLSTDPDLLLNTATVHFHPDGFPNDISASAQWSVKLVHPNTEVTIVPDVFETLPGGNVILTITEKNTGDWPLESISVVLDPGAITLDKTHYYVSGDTLDDGILGVGEMWTWQISVTISVDTDFVVNGYGKVVGLPNIISYDTGYLKERAHVLVKVIGATRTPGFWKTHWDFTQYIFVNELGSHINLGTWGGKTWDITTMEQLMGAMWANNAKNCDGVARTAIDQARMRVVYQLIPAMLNNAMEGGANLDAYLLSHGITSPVLTILESDKLNGSNSINALHQALSDFNIMGDNIALDPDLPATKKGDEAQPKTRADVCWANTTPAPAKGKH